MEVLKSFPWDETTVDVVMVEVQTVHPKKRPGCNEIIGDADKFLIDRGFRIIRGQFTEDMVAVRSKCVSSDKPTGGGRSNVTNTTLLNPTARKPARDPRTREPWCGEVSVEGGGGGIQRRN